MAYIHPDLKDELPGLAMAGLNLIATLRQSGNNARHASADGGPMVGALSAIVAFIVRIWEEKGGGIKDESELLESLFSNPDPNVKSRKLDFLDHKKISAVIKEMTPSERKVFRIAIFLMNPEVTMVDVPEVRNGDKVTQKASTRTERTGVDARMNVLCGIAGHVNEDLSNAKDVSEMLRGTGALGANNESLKFLVVVQNALKKFLCALFGVTEIDQITSTLVGEKAKELGAMIKVPDVRAPGPPVGFLMRIARAVTPGSYGSAKRPKEGRTVLGVWVGIGIALCIAFGVAQYYGYFSDRPLTKQNKAQDEINLLLNNYQPTPLSADKPKQ